MAQNLACIIFTSGSTGRPKGVAIPHYAVSRMVLNTNYMTFEPDDILAHLSSTAFDAATYEIWGALLNGLPLAVVTHETALVPDELAAFLERNGVTVLFIITSLFNQMAYKRPDAYARLRVVMFGGEACDPQAVRIANRQHAPQHLLHMYGPAESTTYASWYPVQEVPDGDGTVPIGYPVANTTLYILDKHLNPVPAGIPGELYVGGRGIARGYNGMPGRSAAVFLPDPFSREPGRRIYKSGDLVRFRPDLNEPENDDSLTIEFIGRVDNQVKIRGFRIELGEIEAVIGQFPAVQESHLLVQEDIPGTKRLIAYLVPIPGQTLSQLELRHFLQSRLPDYMMPATFVTMEALPLTANGKVDWRSLPQPTVERPVLDIQYAAPRSNTEQVVASIWQEILQLTQVGRYDNFFDLGGNSLLLVQVHDRLQQRFGRKIPIVQLFASSTVADVAKYIDEAGTERVAPESSAVAAGLERGLQRRQRTRRRR
jgi:amino acid adenylation domain-containing protein